MIWGEDHESINILNACLTFTTVEAIQVQARLLYLATK